MYADRNDMLNDMLQSLVYMNARVRYVNIYYIRMRYVYDYLLVLSGPDYMFVSNCMYIYIYVYMIYHEFILSMEAVNPDK